MNPRSPCALGALLSALAIAGCEHTGSALHGPGAALPSPPLATGASRYRPGETVTMRLTNTTARTLGYNLCRSSFERLVDNEWSLVDRPLAEVCTAELRALAPGGSASFSFALDRLPEGDYRLRTQVQDFNAPVWTTAYSNVFRIVRENTD